MLRVRRLRKKGLTLDEIAERVKVTRQGARWLLQRSDDFCAPPVLGSYKAFKELKYERNKSVHSS